MLDFLPQNPFPLVPMNSLSEDEGQEHAQLVDKWLGLNTEEIERSLQIHGCRARASESSKEKQELWIGLDVRRLLTPYIEIRALLHELRPRQGSTVVDLGAGYGRMGFVLARHFKGVRFQGYEFVGERVHEFRRCVQAQGLRDIKMDHVDLAAPTFSPAGADIYFIYDFGSSKAIEKVLYDLRRISQERSIILVARGKLCHQLITERHFWLQNIPINLSTRAAFFQSSSEMNYPLAV